MAGNKVKIDIQVDAKKGTKDVKKFGKDTEKSMKQASTGMKGLSTAVKAGIVAFTAMIALKVVSWLKNSFNAMNDLSDVLAKTASNLNTTTIELEQMRFVAELNGIAIGEMDKALFTFNRQLGDAIDGTGTAAEALALLNLNAEELSQMRLPDAMARISEAMNKLTNHTLKAKASYDLFGKAGNKMLLLWKLGPAALKKQANEVLALGGITTKYGTETAQEYNDAVLRLSKAWLGLKQVAIPVLAEIGATAADVGTNAIIFWHAVFSSDPIVQQRNELRKIRVEYNGLNISLKASEKQMSDYLKKVEEGADTTITLWNRLGRMLGLTGTPSEIRDEIRKLKEEIADTEARGQAATDVLLELMGITPGPKAAKFGGKGPAPSADDAAAAAKARSAAKIQQDAINNTEQIMISFEADERVRAERLVLFKIDLINQEYDAKVAVWGKTAELRNELHAKELQAFQERDDTINEIEEAEFDRKLERQEAWIVKQQEAKAREKEMNEEAFQSAMETQTRMDELNAQRDESVWQNMDAQIAKTASFYQKQLELAREAGATEMQIEQMKSNMKKDMGMAALQDAKVVAAQFASQSRNAWRAYKAAAIAQTVISTFKSAQSSYEALAWIPLVGPALGAAAAAVALVAGFARVQSIRKQEAPPASAAEGGVFSGPATGYPATLHGTEAVVPLPGGRGIPVEGGGGGTMVVNIQAVDSQSIVDLMSRNPQAIIGPMVEQMQLGNRNLISTMQNTTREE